MKNDFIHSNFIGTHRKWWFLIDAFFALVGAITAFIDLHIWSPPEQYLTIMTLVFADFFTAVLIANRNGKFETRKSKKILFTLISYTALLFFAFQLSRNEVLLFWLPEAVFMPIVVINLLSLIKNLSLLGYLPKNVAAFLYKNIDRYKNPTDEKPADKNPTA